MKKMLAVVLALAMVGSMSVAAFASTGTGTGTVAFREGHTIIEPPVIDPDNHLYDLNLSFGDRVLGTIGTFSTLDPVGELAPGSAEIPAANRFAGLQITHQSAKPFTVTVYRTAFVNGSSTFDVPLALSPNSNSGAIASTGSGTFNAQSALNVGIGAGNANPIATYTGGSPTLVKASWSGAITTTPAAWAGVSDLNYQTTMTWVVTVS